MIESFNVWFPDSGYNKHLEVSKRFLPAWSLFSIPSTRVNIQEWLPRSPTLIGKPTPSVGTGQWYRVYGVELWHAEGRGLIAVPGAGDIL